jgi:hypothetical protein
MTPGSGCDYLELLVTVGGSGGKEQENKFTHAF